MKAVPGRLKYLFISTLLVILIAVTGGAATGEEPDNLRMLTLDQLMDVDVVSVAKVPEKIRNTPAAIQVITQEDIRRSGVDSIPEALRLVPGLQVHRINGNQWALSARGFSSKFSNKMLVMIDGRTVYSPLFSGVYWDVQDLMLDDIDRIEVIRGPGGSLWGTNAVNGIINIISKDSADTQGGLLKAAGGNYDRGTYAARYGGWLGEDTSYRLYGKYFSRDDFEKNDFTARHNMPDSGHPHDSYRSGRGGFRLDRDQGDDKLTLQGDIYNGTSNQTGARPVMTPPYLVPHPESAEVSGGNILGRWEHFFSSASDLTFQVYYDRNKRDTCYLNETLDTIDFDFQHRLTPLPHHELLWGAGYRYVKDDVQTSMPSDGLYFARFYPESQKRSLYTGFLQDRISFADNRLELTLGTKVEHNQYTGMEWQPSLRLLWKFSPRTSFWGAVTRSVRTPSRLEFTGDANLRPASVSRPWGQTPLVPRLTGNRHLDSVTVLSYELGCKSRPNQDLYLEITGFYNKYHDLIAGFVQGTPYLETAPDGSFLVVPMMIGNHYDAETCGVEISGNWSAADWWRLTTGLTWFDCNILDQHGIPDLRSEYNDDSESRYQASLVSYMDLPGNLELNTMLFYVDRMEEMDIDSFTRLDLNLVWHARPGLSLTVGGRNLLDHAHPEYDGISEGIVGSDIPRTFYGRMTWSF
jgi:iron complex outermembrane receptor protein